MSWHDPDHHAPHESGVLTPDFATTAYPSHANHVPFSLVASRGEDVTVPLSSFLWPIASGAIDNSHTFGSERNANIGSSARVRSGRGAQGGSRTQTEGEPAQDFRPCASASFRHPGSSLNLAGTHRGLTFSFDGILSNPAVAIDRSHERRLPLCREAGNAATASRQTLGNFRRFHIVYLNHDEPSCIRHNGSDLSTPVTDAFVFRERNPAPLSNKGDPFFIWCSVWKVVVMHLDFDPLLPEVVCNDVFSQTAVQKEGGLLTRPVGSHTGWLRRFPTLHARSLLLTGSLIRRPYSARQQFGWQCQFQRSRVDRQPDMGQ